MSKVYWKELKSDDKARNKQRRAELRELIEDYNSGLFPEEKRVLREDEDYFIIAAETENEDINGSAFD